MVVRPRRRRSGGGDGLGPKRRRWRRGAAGAGLRVVAAEMAGWTGKGGDALRVASGPGWGGLSCVGESGRGPMDQGGSFLRSVWSWEPVPVDRRRS
jgi:hypothetical protein